MKPATQVALLAYLEALKAEGFTHIHVSGVIPARAGQTQLSDRQWTQFPAIGESELPEGIFYDRLSGWFFFNEEMYRKAQAH